MGYREQVVLAAKGDVGANWWDHTPRILDYFWVSTSLQWTRDAARQISWCTYFAHWVLLKAGVRPLPAAGTAAQLKSVGGSVGRFLKYSPEALKKTGQTGNGVYNFHSVSSKLYTPKAGDLYYKPKPNNHVGVIIGVSGTQIWTADGNSGPLGWDKKFFVSYAKNGSPVKRIGDGFVFTPGAPKTLGVNDFYIEIPDA